MPHQFPDDVKFHVDPNLIGYHTDSPFTRYRGGNMKHVVYKYTFESPEITLDLPINAEVLSVGAQNGDIVMWVRLDPEMASKKPRQFMAINTGDPWESKDIHEFIGTVTVGAIVWHIFEVVTKPLCILNSHDVLIAAGQRCPSCLETE